MFVRTRSSWLKKTAIAGVLSLGALSLAGCATSGSEEGADVEDLTEGDAEIEEEPAEGGSDGPYDGVYDDAFLDDYDGYVGETVTVSADVNEIVSPESFTIAGTDETTVEPLLIVHDGSAEEVAEGLTVKITGVVHESFDLPTVEEDMDLDLQDDEAFDDWDGARYIEATSIDTSVAADE